MKEIASQSGVKTLIIINQGIHHNKFDDEFCSADCRGDSLTSLTTVATSFYEELAASKRDDMDVMWRESTPQNFPTSNGQWATHGFCKQECPCVPLSLNMKFGFGLYPRCEPSCYPANIRNVLTNPIVEAAHMPVLRIYDALADAPFNIHRNELDCTHLNSDALIYLNEELIRLIT